MKTLEPKREKYENSWRT